MQRVSVVCIPMRHVFIKREKRAKQEVSLSDNSCFSRFAQKIFWLLLPHGTKKKRKDNLPLHRP